MAALSSEGCQVQSVTVRLYRVTAVAHARDRKMVSHLVEAAFTECDHGPLSAWWGLGGQATSVGGLKGQCGGLHWAFGTERTPALRCRVASMREIPPFCVVVDTEL